MLKLLGILARILKPREADPRQFESGGLFLGIDMTPCACAVCRARRGEDSGEESELLQ
jgi:hypothetical protein